MTFTIIDAAALVSNKPHLPKPKPPPSMFPIKRTLPDGRATWISIPQPDKLSINVPLGPSVYGNGVPQSLSVGVFANELHQWFVGEPWSTMCLDPGPTYPAPKKAGSSKTWKFLILAMGIRDASVRFEIRGSPKKGFSLRIECNPRKLGKAGFAQLAKVLGGPSAPFNLAGLISAARVSRLDVCVDVIGVRMSELVLWFQAEGKRTLYAGEDGALETIQLHRKLPTSKAATSHKPKSPKNQVGQVVLKAYDRVRQLVAAQQPAPFGKAPVVRLERVQTRFLKCPLKNLPSLPNKFDGFRVGFARSQVSTPIGTWLRYLALRRTMSEVDAIGLLGIQAEMSAKFRAAERVPNPDLLNSKEVWPHWMAGLEHSGLLGFLALE